MCPQHEVMWMCPQHEVMWMCPQHEVMWMCPQHEVMWMCPLHEVMWMRKDSRMFIIGKAMEVVAVRLLTWTWCYGSLGERRNA